MSAARIYAYMMIEKALKGALDDLIGGIEEAQFSIVHGKLSHDETVRLASARDLAAEAKPVLEAELRRARDAKLTWQLAVKASRQR